jgi:hypothetical protein
VDTPPIQLEVAFRRDGDALEGYVTAPDLPRRPFTGWLSLLCALEAAMTAGGAQGGGGVAPTERT